MTGDICGVPLSKYTEHEEMGDVLEVLTPVVEDEKEGPSRGIFTNHITQTFL